MSKVLRPVTPAPIIDQGSRRSSALAREILNTISVPCSGKSVSPLEYHLKSRSPPSPRGLSRHYRSARRQSHPATWTGAHNYFTHARYPFQARLDLSVTANAIGRQLDWVYSKLVSASPTKRPERRAAARSRRVRSGLAAKTASFDYARRRLWVTQGCECRAPCSAQDAHY